MDSLDDVLATPLDAFHRAEEARMTAFAGYAMPLQYKPGIMKEHLHCRTAAGLFDVSHMGQVEIRAKSGRLEDAARALEALVPVDILGLAPGRQRYAVFTDESGGILDDMMVTNLGDRLFLVVNAACKGADLAHLEAGLGETCEIAMIDDRALVALQGPKAAAVVERLAPDLAATRFMDVRETTLVGAPAIASRSGYTGEDGFEISIPATQAESLALALVSDAAVEPIGLGARDSLRLEAGLCLYGNDIDRTTTPVEAALTWAIQKARRTGGDRAGGFPGASRILGELDLGPARLRVGLRPEGRAPIRTDVELFAGEDDTNRIGRVTSGVFGPSVGAPVAMGYVDASMARAGTRVFAEVRGKRLPVTVTDMPFVTHNYKRA